MFAAVAGYVGSVLSDIVQKWIKVGGLALLGLLILIFAVGYALNAVHSYIAASVGAVAASLWIGGGLTTVALICVLAAVYINKKPRKALSVQGAVSAMKEASVPTVRLGGAVTSLRAATAGAVVGLAVVLRLRASDHS